MQNWIAFRIFIPAMRKLVITPEGTRDREQVIEGTLLGIKRSVDECSYLAKLSAELPSGSYSHGFAGWLTDIVGTGQ